jgi:hypothetical protein
MAIFDQFEPYYKVYNVKSSNNSIHKFTIYGERHSGTNWLEEIITKKFDLPITWEYGHKHFFGFESFTRLVTTTHNTLFIGIVRNIYDWIQAMQKMPYHIRYSKSKEHIVNVQNIISYKNNKIINQDKNIYNLNIYNNIFELRSVKLHYLYYHMPLLVDNYILIRYEDLLINNHKIIEIISKIFKLKTNINYNIICDKSKLKGYNINHDVFESINNNTRWDIESLYCYKKKYSNLDNRTPCY